MSILTDHPISGVIENLLALSDDERIPTHEPRHKFKLLAAQYSLFHNLHRENLDEYESAELAFFQRKLPASAFRFEPIAPVTYDD